MLTEEYFCDRQAVTLFKRWKQRARRQPFYLLAVARGRCAAPSGQLDRNRESKPPEELVVCAGGHSFDKPFSHW